MKKLLLVLFPIILGCNNYMDYRVQGEINLGSITRSLDATYEIESVEIWVTNPDAEIILNPNTSLFTEEEVTSYKSTGIIYYSDYISPIDKEDVTTDTGTKVTKYNHEFRYIDRDTIGFVVEKGSSYKFTFRTKVIKSGVPSIYTGSTIAFLTADTTLKVTLVETKTSQSTTF